MEHEVFRWYKTDITEKTGDVNKSELKTCVSAGLIHVAAS